MEIVHQVNSTYNEVNSHLRILQKEGIIFDEHFGRLRVIRLNMENPRTLILLEALRILKSGENKNHHKANTTQRSRNPRIEHAQTSTHAMALFKHACKAHYSFFSTLIKM
jgi:hypothetical protein